MNTFLKMALTVTSLFILPNLFYGQAPNLGTTSGFALFTGTGAFNGDSSSIVTGDIGTNTGTHTFTGILNGTAHWGDAIAVLAATDVGVAFSSFPGGGIVVGVGLGGQSLMPGIYTTGSGAAATLNGVLTLNGGGNSDAIFVIQIDSTLDVSDSSSVLLINGANLCNVYFRINGAFSMGAGSGFSGTVVASGAIHLGSGATLSGRALSTTGAINMNANVVTLSTTPDPSTISADGATTFCAGGSVVLSGNDEGGTWSNGSSMPSITVTTSGGFFVTNSNSCGTVNSDTIVVTVIPLPDSSVITADGALVFCEGDSVILSGNDSGGTWSNGATTPSITVKTSGDYFVTDTNACGTVNSNHFIVQVDTLLIVSILVTDGDTVFCEGDSVILSGNDGGTWSNGATTPTITVKTSGDYFVTTFNSCDTFISNHILVTVIPFPVQAVISADGPTTICVGDSVILAGNNGGIWSNGATTVSITVKTSGDYFVTNTNNCDTVTSNHILITVDTLLTIDSIFAGGSTTFCVEDSVILSGNDGGTWSTGDTSATLIVKTSGEYFVFRENSCDSVFSNFISVNVIQLLEPAAITAGGDTTFCAGDSVVLSGNIGGIWNTGDTTTTITVKTSGEFYVINQNVCDSVASNHIVVTVVELPTDNAGVDDTICKGQSITLGGPPTPGHTYSWSPSSGLSSSTISNPVATTGVTKKYTLIETITGLGCQATSTVTITVSPYPSCVIKGNTKICEGQTATLCTAAGPGYTYLWSNGDTTRCIEVSDPGRYTVTVTNAMGCSSICGQTVIRGEGPCEITGKSDIYDGNTTVLCATSGYASYLWSTGATTPCITVGGAGTYSVTLTTSNGCVSVCSKTVNVIPFLCEIQIDTLCRTLYTLCAPEFAGNTYFWPAGGQTTRCITVDCSGNYPVRLTNGRLSSTCSVYINAEVWGPRAQSTWSISGNLAPSQGQISTLCAPFGFSEYHWSNGAKTQCITINSSGFYGVNFSYKTSCSGSAGTTVNFSSSRRASQVDVVPPVMGSANIEVRAYPNPFKNSAVFEVQNNESDAHVTIELVDLNGMKVARVFDADVVRGTRHTTVFDAGLLSDGIYFYRYVSGNQLISKKLILMK